MKKFILIMLVIFSFTLSGCKEKSDTIIVLTSSGYEPYEIIDTSGNLTGFDIELMEALALEANVEIEWKDVDFDGIIASLQAGQGELAIAGISPTEERKEMVDFSNIYYNSDAGLTNFLLFDSSSNITGLDDLDGLIVAAQLGTVQATLLDSISDEYGFTVDLRNTYTQIVEEVKAGRIDAFVVEKIISESILTVNDSLTKVGFESSLDDVTGNAIAFSKDSEYVDLFNTALQVLKDNGVLDQLIEKWF
ncbi:Arginine-binding extracellular protein ArtP precursor [Candidatus Izimaplasma bacterium HR1]|jgi:polar amino acid transport system substrate-binding protein|uniref:transporter substrate-binding domain-containing protein n=1 Tax=Candidatus Izimoplasma sp. HR1 TaxID=1541959 RepID=UPI0004F90569|nr:Arginine-binding extracellular protein ArtP precursor [Candidatus Izimaplasma bacterium HR1]